MASLFSKIIDREIPADIVYEDDVVIAFLDINPINDGHTLVVPKLETPDFASMPEELIGPFFERVQTIAKAVITGVHADGFNLLMNTGAHSGQDIFHAHAHVIPRFEGDGFEHWHGTGYENDEAKQACAEQIRAKLD